MQTLEAIAKRKSTRDFDPDKAVSNEIIETIVKAGCQAPIGANQRESLHLTVCRSREIMNEINQSTAAAMKMEPRDFFYGAPVVIIVSAAEKQMAPGIEYANAACVIENMLITATDAGVGNIYSGVVSRHWQKIRSCAQNWKYRKASGQSQPLQSATARVEILSQENWRYRLARIISGKKSQAVFIEENEFSTMALPVGRFIHTKSCFMHTKFGYFKNFCGKYLRG